MDNIALAQLLFPDVSSDIQLLEEKYPERNLKEGAAVTRFAPSPTGYLHLGGLFGAFADILTAKATGGVSFLRIEDTDKKREIDDGVSAIVDGFSSFDLSFDEGVTSLDGEKGDYGPYTQSKRLNIYHTVAKKLVEEGKAYPCFCTADELSEMREKQESEGALIRGYFGKWAKCRDLTLDEIKKNISDGKPYVLRFRSQGQEDKRITFVDLVRGKIEMPENIIDEVLLKSDGIPTYHFAHVCDDHFMRTTHVIRGEEWISSVPKHIEMFKACGFKVPKYAHTPQVMKIDEVDSTKRKLSKRKDPEAAVSYFTQKGYPSRAVLEYLLTLLNSNFEDWRRANKDEDIFKFPFSIKKMSVSGCLFDIDKLNDISKTVISKMNVDSLLGDVLSWSEKYDKNLNKLFVSDLKKARSILNIDRENKKPRKDIAFFEQIADYVKYFYFEPGVDEFTDNLSETNVDNSTAKEILEMYIPLYDEGDDKNTWFDKFKNMCEPLSFTPNVKEYKSNPDQYRGHVGDISSVVRLAVTGRINTPDLYEIMKILGRVEVEKRINNIIDIL